MSLQAPRNGSLVAEGPADATAELPPKVNGGQPPRPVRRAAESQQTEDAQPRFHRINTVREREGVSLRSVARALHVDVRSLRAQEDESSDIMLSTLYEWQKVLDVPISELLVDNNDPLSPAVLQRARLVKIMKTVAAILERTDSRPIRRTG